VLDDRVLAAAMIQMIVERAKLQNKARGVMDWVHGGKPYRIKVEEYEHFGESAFRLRLGKSRQKRASHAPAADRAVRPTRTRR